MKKLEAKVLKWHQDRDLINGSTDAVQWSKGLEEHIELHCAIHAGISPLNSALCVIGHTIKLYFKGRIKSVFPYNRVNAIRDAIGDKMVVDRNIAHRNGSTLQDCLTGAFSEIEYRTGNNVNGNYVKDEK